MIAFLLPIAVESHTTSEVLAMSYLDGQPIEALTEQPAARRNVAAAALLELALREVFEWGLVQTDPNFANYRYEPASGRIALLDFGATRAYAPAQRESLRNLLCASVEGDDTDITQCAIQVGYLGEGDPAEYRDFVVTLLRMATEPLRMNEGYDF